MFYYVLQHIFNVRDYCNIPKEYYLKKIIKEINYIKRRINNNPNAGKFKFMKTRAKTYNINN